MASGFAGRGLIDDPGAVLAVWHDALDARPWAGPALWLHGDLHPAGVLTRDGTLCGVADLGDLCAGISRTTCPPPGCCRTPGRSGRRTGRRPTTPRCAAPAAGRWRVLSGLLVAAGDGPGGKPSWGPPALAALRRLL
ncbi:hypothetical protein [Actinoplanes sp. NPDC020271]|uniref:hypothetical protein n=1 Tax=Actinoplanes sp. NPDC020271 TaxID=3363896 RepID=UPI0037AE4880